MSLILDEHPNAIAEAMTGRPHISYSAITAYQACPLRWYFRYVAGLPEKTVSASLVLGGAIHRAVEFHYRELLAGNPPPDLDTLLAEYQDAWRERDIEHVRFGKGDDINTLGASVSPTEVRNGRPLGRGSAAQRSALAAISDTLTLALGPTNHSRNIHAPKKCGAVCFA